MGSKYRDSEIRQLLPYKCYRCGKVFYPEIRELWAYKRYVYRDGGTKVKMFCSWGCLRAFDRELVKSKSKRGRKKKEVLESGQEEG